MKKKLSQTAQIQLCSNASDACVRSLCSLALTDIHAVAWLGGYVLLQAWPLAQRKLAIACSHAPTYASKHTYMATT